MDRQLVIMNTLNFFVYSSVTGARVAFTLLALELGAGAFEVGVITGGMQLALVLFSMPVAIFIERLGTRLILALGALCGALGLLMPYFFPSLPMVIAGALVFGLWNVFTFQPTQRLVVAFSRPEQRARNFSDYAFVAGLTVLVGPLVAGLSIDAIGHLNVMLVFLPCALACLLLLAFSGASFTVKASAPVRPSKIRDTLADARVWHLIAVSSVSAMAFELFPFFVPLHGHAAGLSASTIGAILSASAFGSLALPLILPMLVRRAGEERVMGICLGLSALGFALLPFTVSPLLLGFCSFLYGFGTAASIPVTSMMAYGRLPEERASHFLGLRNVGNGTMRAFAPPVFGALAAAMGLPGVFWIAAFMMGAAGGWIGRAPRHKG